MRFKCRFDRERGLPLILMGFVIVLDQVTKSIVAARWYIGAHIWPEPAHWDDLLQIIHVRNTAIAFSIGQNLPDPAKRILFVILPVIVLCILVWYYLSSDEFTRLQRWATAGILGGGIGNIADRIMRPDGVVDFISVKLPEWFVWDRWPTFNVADASVVVSCFLLLVTIFMGSRKAITATAVTEEEPSETVAMSAGEGPDEQET